MIGSLSRTLRRAVLLFAVGIAPYALAAPENCLNEIDDDRNGAVDCQDAACQNTWVCQLRCPEQCANGRDDDGNGRVDCDDPACKNVFVCEPTVEHCANAIDDDRDGDVDCADEDCDGVAVCLPTYEVCTGGQDEDGDGDVDCRDGDCRNIPPCQACIMSIDPEALKTRELKTILPRAPVEPKRIEPNVTLPSKAIEAEKDRKKRE